MAATLQGTPSVYENAAATSVVLPYPTGVQAGEFLLAVITHTNSGAPQTNPGGWTMIRAQNGLTSSPSTTTWYKWATGVEAEGGTVTFPTTSGGGRVTGIMARYSGVDPTTPIDSPVQSTSVDLQTTFTVPPVTTATANALVLHAIALNSSGSTDISTPAGSTRVASSTSIGRDTTLFQELKPVAGIAESKVFSNVTGSSLNWAGITFALRGTGGEPPPPPPEEEEPGTTGPPPTGTSPILVSRVVGIHDTPSTNARVQTRTQNAVSVRLRCSIDREGTQGVVFGPAVTPSSRGDARLTISGLQPNTRYHYRVMMTNSVGGEHPDVSPAWGRLKTAPAGPATFSFCFASCNTSNTTQSYESIGRRGDDMFIHVGDLYYADGSGTGIDNFRSKMHTAVSTVPNMWATMNTMYIPSDHDGMNNNGAAGSDATAWQNWNIARSEIMPNPQSYFTHQWGPRVRFIHIDTRSFKSHPDNTDNSSKTALGATQKAWLKTTIQNATEPIIIISQDAQFAHSTDTGDDGWGGYITERNELATFFSGIQNTTEKRIVMLGGDMHALAANDGSSSPGNIVLFQAAPLHTTSSHKGGPWTSGPYPGTGISGTRQYGRVTIEDTGGTTIRVIFKGYSSGTTSDTERMSVTKTFTVEAYQTTTPGTQVQVTRAQVSAIPPASASVRILRAELSVPVGTASVLIHSAQLAVVGSADPGVNVRNLSPGLTVTMTGEAPGAPVFFTWDQIAGPTVTKTVSNDTTQCTYITPALRADSVLAFRVVANYADGTKSGEGITRHEVTRTAHTVMDSDGSTSTVTFRPIEVGVPTTGGEEEPDPEEPPPPPPPPPGYQPNGGPAGVQWELKLSDDFNELNRTLWSPKLRTEGGVNNTSGTYERNVTIENGELNLRLESATSGAAISSNPMDGIPGHTGFEFNLGYLEARIFIPGNGTTMYNWPVFLTQGQIQAHGEYDIMEAGGWKTATHTGDNLAHVVYHWDELGIDKNQTITVPGSWSNGWHTYALDRKDNGVNDYYYDGVLVHSHVRREEVAHYIAIINEATGTTAQMYGDASKVKVDYVRVWTRKVETAPTTGVRYVSSSGSDSNVGSQAAPWATLAKVQSAITSGEVGRGSQVLFKRGDTFYGSLNVPTLTTGTTGFLDLGSYGTGDKPKILGYKVSGNSWVVHTTGVWKLNITANSGQYTGNVSSTETNVGFLRVNGAIKGAKKATLAELTSDWDFFADATYVYTKLATNPGAGVEIAVRQDGVRLVTNSRCWNLHLDGHGGNGIVVLSSNTSIKDCIIENIGGSHRDATTRYGNGVELSIGCANVTVENNVIKQTYHAATSMQGTIAGANKAWSNCHIKLNQIENCNMSLELWSQGVAAAGTGFISCSFVDNVCKDAGYSWAALLRPDSLGRGAHVITYAMQLPTQFESARNIFLRARHNYAYTADTVWPQGFNSHNNQITLAPTQKIVFQQPEAIEQAAGYVARTGNELGTQWTISGEAPSEVDGVTAAATLNWGPVIRGDEFNYTGPPDPAKWYLYNSAGHAGQGLRRPSQISVNGSALRIDGTTNGTTGGMSAIYDRNVPKYYRIETRMRTSVRHPEYHPVLLLWADNVDGGQIITGVPEIDYAEGTGTTTQIKFFLHWYSSTTTQASRTLDTREWHNYGMEWTAQHVIGYIDGVEWFRDENTTHVPQEPMHSTIQLDWFPGDSPDANPPACWMEVAWTREYNI